MPPPAGAWAGAEVRADQIDRTGPLFRLAERIARNREVLGLHYRSGSTAGQTLATCTAGRLEQCPLVQRLMAQARDEWRVAEARDELEGSGFAKPWEAPARRVVNDEGRARIKNIDERATTLRIVPLCAALTCAALAMGYAAFARSSPRSARR
jgi:hypothetical protein